LHCSDFLLQRFHLNTSTCFFPDQRKDNELLIKTSEGYESSFDQSILQPYLNSMQFKSESILVTESFDIATHNARNSNDLWKILDEQITEISFSFFSAPDELVLWPLVERFGKRLTENGVLHRLIAKWIHFENLRPQPERGKPKVLGMKHVGVGFKVYGMSLGLSLLVFVLESLKPFIKIKIVHYLINLFL